MKPLPSHPPHRTVVIVRDTASPLYALRCAEPCQAQGWCMDMGGKPGCYLGGCLSEAGARKIAERAGYTIRSGDGA